MKKKQKLLHKLLKKLKSPTKHCIKCFKKIEENNVVSFAKSEYFLCNSCLNEKKTNFQSFVTNGVKCYSIYDYDDYIQTNLNLLKRCFDYEIRKLFLHPFEKEISIHFRSYILVAVPSLIEDDEKRGFNHVEAIFSLLGLKFVNVLEKIKNDKFRDHKTIKAEDTQYILQVNNVSKLKGKNVLLVDDVYVTGSTIKTCIDLIKQCDPKTIKVLVIAKSKDSKQNY